MTGTSLVELATHLDVTVHEPIVYHLLCRGWDNDRVYNWLMVVKSN